MPDPADIEAYATALLALADASGRREAYRDQVSEVLDLVNRHTALRRFLADPGVQPDGKLAALDRLLGTEIEPSIKHILLILQDAGALPRLEAVVDAFRHKLAGLDNRLSGEVISAVPLAETRRKAIQDAAARILGREVVLEYRTDRSLIGGLRLRVGNLVMDDTVDRRLEGVRRRLAS